MGKVNCLHRRADGQNAPNVLQHDDDSLRGSVSKQASRAQHCGAVLEQTHMEANEFLTTIVTGLDKDTNICETAVHFNNQLKALSVLDKNINTTKVQIGTLTDRVHKLEESRCAYSEKLADIQDSEQALPRREKLCQTNIAEIQKLIDDVKNQMSLEEQVLGSLEQRRRAKQLVIDGLDESHPRSKSNDKYATLQPSGSGRKRRRGGDKTALGASIRRHLKDYESRESNDDGIRQNDNDIVDDDDNVVNDDDDDDDNVINVNDDDNVVDDDNNDEN